MNRRHRLDDRGRKDARDSIDRIVVNVAGAYGQVHDFACAHEDALESRLMPGALDAFDRLDDEWRGDLIDLTTAKWSDDVSLHPPLFVLIRHDPPALEVLPQCPSVAQCVTARRFLAKFLALSPGYLPGLHEAHFWPVAKCDVRDTAAM